MAGCVYHLLRCHNSTSAKRIESTVFPLSDHANFGDIMLLFCRERLRNVHLFHSARAELLFCQLDILLCQVFIAITVLVCLVR